MRQIWTPPDHHPEGPGVCDRIHPLPMTRERLGVHAADMGGSTVDALDENPWNSAVLTRLAEAVRRSCPLCGHLLPVRPA